MRQPQPLGLTFLAALAFGTAAHSISKTVYGQGTPYQPSPAKPAPELPAEVTLSARVPYHPAVAIHARNCSIDVLRNDLVFGDKDAMMGLRFPKAPKDTRVVVEFLVRLSALTRFNLRSTISPTENSPTTSVILQKGLQRITLRAMAPKDREGRAEITTDSDAVWQLNSVTIRRG